MSNQQSEVWCIIVTYNGMKWIHKCLSSLRASRYPVKTMVIDNASTDNTVDHIKQNFSEVILIQEKANLGFGQAANKGLKMALNENADYIFLLNQDTWIKENTIEELLKAAKNNPAFGIISPFHLDVSGKNFELLFLAIFSRHNRSLVPDIFFNRIKAIYDTEYIHAASWFMTRDCVITTGGFDPIYFHYGEDDDYLQRAKHFKFKIGLVPSALIVHDAVFNSPQKLEWNEHRNKVIALQQLKKMSAGFGTNVLLFLKRGFDELTTYLLFLKLKKFKFRFVVLFKTLLRLRSIHKSYKLSFKKGSFLNL